MSYYDKYVLKFVFLWSIKTYVCIYSSFLYFNSGNFYVLLKSHHQSLPLRDGFMVNYIYITTIKKQP